RLTYPPAGTILVGGAGRHRVLHPDAEFREFVGAGVFAFQPVAEPAQYFLQEAGRGSRHAQMGVAVAPGTDQCPARHVEMLDQAEDGVGITVGPAADRKDRAGDRRVILADGMSGPIGVAPLMFEPVPDPEAALLKPFQPHAAP